MQAHGLKPLLCMAAHARRGGREGASITTTAITIMGIAITTTITAGGQGRAGHGRARQWQQQVIWHLVAAAAAPTTAMGVVVESVA
jgi:hypothetical protein